MRIYMHPRKIKAGSSTFLSKKGKKKEKYLAYMELWSYGIYSTNKE
jgi:hypothetical protein